MHSDAPPITTVPTPCACPFASSIIVLALENLVIINGTGDPNAEMQLTQAALDTYTLEHARD